MMREGQFSRATVGTYEMQAAIMQGQLEAEEEVIRSWNEDEEHGRRQGDNEVKLLSDRSAVDPIVYAALADVPGVFEKSRKLLNDPSFRRILPLYRHSSLFGASD